MTGPRIFVIDDQADFRRLLGHHLTVRWPDAAIQYYDPVSSGRLPLAFSGAGSDVVLLGSTSANDDAIDWLRQLRRNARFPPIIFLGGGDEQQVVDAVKAGAENYIGRSTMTHARLVEAVEHAMAASQHSGSARSGGATQDSALPGLPGYENVRTLSEGEIATVHLARETVSGRLIVLKVLRQVPDSGGDKHFDRFLQEYELIARVDHPNVVRIYDLGVADDHAYIAMEYCSRGTLKRRIAEGLLPDEAWSLVRVIAGALGALHSVGICHRDLKPTNIMFREDGSPVLIDFGLAKHAQFQAGITGTGAIFGTPYYMSPEQGQGSPVDQRSDIYSLGIVLYEALTGRKPYDGPAAMSVIIQHRDAPLPQLPAELRHYQPVLDRMLAKRPAERFQSVDELLAWAPASKPLGRAAR
jgi:eukaryotic-like serine/threonine-protein kinase